MENTKPDLTDLEKSGGQQGSFRDTLATVDQKGKRIWIFPKKPSGRYYEARKWVGWFLLAFLFAAPLIKINGQPLFLFNILERKFVLFGFPFWPQDFYLFGVAMILFIVFIIFFTVVFGRVWCGWACPQTVFMELVFRRIEYWIDGDAGAQRKLAQMPWNKEKTKKRIFKHTIFLLISSIIGHTVLSWIIGIDQVFDLITASPVKHPAGFIAMTVSTLVFYGVYARFREQMCTTFCPYGRLQGVMLGADSMVVAYDDVRGEPRGKISKTQKTAFGDCVDCKLCVQVCPTGIDIRNGTQLECVNCTACMDACDEVMEKTGREKGLIRYASHNSVRDRVPFAFSGRMKAYTVVIVFLIAGFITLLLNRSTVEATILRTPGSMYQEQPDGYISNLYKVLLVNKSFEEQPVSLKLTNPEGRIRVMGLNNLTLAPNSSLDAMVFVDLPRNAIHSVSNPVVIEIFVNEIKTGQVKTNFVGPATKNQ